MKTYLTLLIFFAACCLGHAEPVTFPTKSGEYSHKGWRYVYKIDNPGTRSEKRIGKLYFQGKEVKGEIGELNQEPIGFMFYFGESGHNQGWLNTMTYDRSIFKKDGNPSVAATEALQSARPRLKKSEKAGADQPATRSESKLEGGDNPQPGSERRSR